METPNIGSDNFLNNLLEFFRSHSLTGMDALQPYAYELVAVLAIIDFCIIWTLYDGEMRLSLIINKVMKIGLFFFLVLNWDAITEAVLKSLMLAGTTASSVEPTTDLFTPSGIVTLGFKQCEGLFNEFEKISITDLGKCLMLLIGIAITLISFFFISLQLLITKVEFYIFSSLAMILLPFGSLRYTSFLFQRVVSGVISFGIKIMVMYFILGLFLALSDSFVAVPAPGTPSGDSSEAITFSTMLKGALSYAVLGFLTWKIPNLASSLMNGQPSMNASDVIGGAMSAKAATVAAAGAVGGVAGAVAGGVGKAASAYGYTNATIKAARVDVSQGNSSNMGSAFAKNIARQSFASSTIGKGLMRGANKAINSREDYKNLKSGEYAEKPQKNRND